MSWGIQPSVLCGHSLGEYVAAHLAGIYSLEDALKVVSARGILISNLPKGNMLSIQASVEILERLLLPELSIAAINSKELCVVAGEDEHIATFAQILDHHEISNQLLSTSHAFHSAMMEPIISDFHKVLQSVQLKNPQIPIVSTVTGTWLKDEQATDISYWAEHIRNTVRFADALDTINTLENPLFLEVGPGRATSTLARRQLTPERSGIIISMEKNKGGSEIEGLLRALGQAWLQGIEPDWNALYGGRVVNKVVLPNYAFNKSRYWVDPPSSTPVNVSSQEPLKSENKTTRQVVRPKTQNSRIQRFEKLVEGILKVSGIDHFYPSQSFLEMGLDSLLLTQVALNLRKEFNLPISFRKLNEEYHTPALLVQYLDENLPEEIFQEKGNISLPLEIVDHPRDSIELPAMVESINLQLQQLSAQLLHIQNLLVNENKDPTKIQARFNTTEGVVLLENPKSHPENLKEKRTIVGNTREVSSDISFQKDTNN